jgi:hypothetical protein
MRAAANHIEQRLEADGLWRTLVEMLELLGAQRFTTNTAARLGELWSAGFPVDWLEHFQPPTETANDPASVVAAVARGLASGESRHAVIARFTAAEFRFRPSAPGFQAALEDGQQRPGLVRLQAGGGLRAGGLVPGGSLAVMGDLVAALPEVDFQIAVPASLAASLRTHALNQWPLRRPGHITLLPTRADITSWAQDNGKPGLLGGKPATLMPRYASSANNRSLFMPAESAVLAAFQASGQRVVQSPLLFQGGDLVVARVPASGRRVLLLGAAEVARNMALGLTAQQVTTAFCTELGVDQAVVIPTVSYHLDIDVNVRAIGGKLAAFVNDPLPAARIIAASGVRVLIECGALNESNLPQGWLGATAAGGVPSAVQAAIAAQRGVDGRFPSAFARRFAADPSDAAGFQLEAFLLALDLLSSAAPAAGVEDDQRRKLRAAWKMLFDGLEQQARVLRDLGWEIIRVPSLPDTHLSLNHLNGVHTPDRYLMPVLGGRLKPLDDAAAQVFRRALGGGIHVVPIHTLESQRIHGALHCMIAAYPTGTE